MAQKLIPCCARVRRARAKPWGFCTTASVYFCIEKSNAKDATKGRTTSLLGPFTSGLGPLGLAFAGLFCLCSPAAELRADDHQAAAANLSQPARLWAAAAAANQERIVQTGDTPPLMYRIRKVDARGDSTRVIVESRDGAVARTLGRNGGTLTAEEDTAERARLMGIEQDPESFIKRHKRDRAGQEYAVELVHALPSAMFWSYAPGQPQLGGAAGQQVVLDFTPDPGFHPPNLVTEGLTGIAGRVWIDATSGCVQRIEGHILRPVDFGWGGMLAKVSQGGTIALEQAQAAPGRWFYTHLTMHLTVREMLVHTVEEKTESRAWDARLLAHPVSVQAAVQQLLLLPVTVR